MVSVALAMVFPLTLEGACGRFTGALTAKCPLPVLFAFQAASHVPVLRAVRVRIGVDIAWPSRNRKEMHEVHDVSGLSESHGPDGAVAEWRRLRAEISQSR